MANSASMRLTASAAIGAFCRRAAHGRGSIAAQAMTKRQEVVIAGFTAPKRTRPYFGALVLALREGKEWRFIGHVGTGFNHETLKELHGKLIKLKMAKSPFPRKVRGEAVTTWVKPTLVAEVKFTEWTNSGEMRHPVYLGLSRPLKKSADKSERI
jgi:bifunctional non-homologous end joining protein LigD